MHAGKIESSGRLKATIAALWGGWRTTLEISKATGSLAVHSDIAGLRANGVQIETRYAGRTEFGNKIYAYRISDNKLAV